MKPGLRLFLPLGAAVLLLAALALLGNSQAPESSNSPAQAAIVPVAAVGGAPAKPQVAAPAEATEVEELAQAVAPTEEKIRQALEDFKRSAVYPPWSRRHDEGTRYLVDWNVPIVEPAPVDTEGDSGLTYRFGADRAAVGVGEALTSWIEVSDREGNRRAITVTQAWVEAPGDAARQRMVSLVYNDQGVDGDEVAGDHRYTNRFIPSNIEAFHEPRQVHIVAELEVDGRRLRAIRPFDYAARPVLRVVGVSDELREGSLALLLDVEVLEAGRYKLQANIFTGDGLTALAYADRDVALAQGQHRVELKFFGKVLYDSAADGPYLVRDLRGFLRKDGEGEANIGWSHPTQHRTRAYRHRDFSAAEWDDAEKRAHLSALTTALDMTTAGQLGVPTAQPRHLHIGADGIAREVQPGDVVE